MLHRGLSPLALALILAGPAQAEYTFRPFNQGGSGIGTVNGIVKGDGAGNPSQAVAGTDYLGPSLINGRIYIGSVGNLATGVTMGGDCTLVAAGTLTCTKTNGTSFTSAATTNIGTSGATIPLLSTANTWTLAQTFNGSNNDPSLTAARGIMTTVGANTIALNTGITATAPYGSWLQTKDTGSGGGGSGTAYPIRLNPLGGTVAVGTASPDVGAYMQVRDNWCDDTYLPFGTPCILAPSSYFFEGISAWGRTVGAPGSGHALSGFCFGNNAAAHGCWPLYTEAHRTTQLDYAGSEFSAVNRYNDAKFLTPYGTSGAVGGSTAGLQIDCGNGLAVASGAQYGCSFGLGFVRNQGSGQTINGFGAGIVFQLNSLDMVQNDPAPAISFPSSSTEHYALSWYTSITNPVWRIYSNATTTSNQNNLVLGDSSASFLTTSVGIGTASPSAQLHTTGSVLLGSAGGTFKSSNTGIGGVSGCLSSDGATPANITAGTCGTGTLPTGGSLGQILGKYDSTNGHSNWYTPGEFNISMDPLTDCSGVSASDTAFTTAFASHSAVLVPQGCTVKLSNSNTIAKGNTLVVPNGGVVSLDAKTTAVSGAVTCPSACVTGNVRLTVGSTAYLTSGMRVTVASVGGTTEANGSWIIVVIDGTHIDLVGTTFANAYTSGGTVTVCNLLFRGTIRAGASRVFSGAGMACGTADVLPEWYGASNDGATDDIAPLRAAWNSVASSAGSDGAPTIRFSPGSGYAITDQWTLAPSFSIPLRILGAGQSKSRICAKSGFSATSAVQVNGQKADGATEVSDLRFDGFGIVTCSGVANTGLAVRGITFGSVGQQIQGSLKSSVSDFLIDGFITGIMNANTRLIKWDRIAVNLPKLNNSTCVQADQLDTTNFTSDQRWTDFQCVPWGVAADGITGQRDIYLHAGSGTTGLAGMFFDHATLYPPYNANSRHVDMLCDGANVTETWFTDSQFEGGALSAAKSFYAHSLGAGQCYDINISGGYMQGVAGDGIFLEAASSDKIYDVTITNFTPFRGIGGTPILAKNTNNVVIANNTFTSQAGVAQFVYLDTAYGTVLTGNAGNAGGGGASTNFVDMSSTSQNTGCVNNRFLGVVTNFSAGIGAGFNDCTGGGVNANRP